jgi:hypothetical protein
MNPRARLTYIVLTALFPCLALATLSAVSMRASAHAGAHLPQASPLKSGAKTFIIAARRSGDVEFIDPATLETVSRIHIDVNPNGVGLNGVFVNEDGSTIYVEGPTSQEGRACCSLYSIDLATMETKKAAGIWGSSSREPIVIADGVVYQAPKLASGGIIKNEIGFGFHLSSNRSSLIGMTSSLAPEIDLYDLSAGASIRKLKQPDLGQGWWASGTWSGDNFYLYASKPGQPDARVWTLSSNTTQLGDGIIVDPHGEVPGCQHEIFEAVSAAEGNLFLYELFGGKFDRRPGCGQQVPGGAWLLDPTTGRLVKHVAPDLYFCELIADRARPVLYGLSADGENFYQSTKLARIDAHDGSVLQIRILDSDLWRIVTAPVQTIPATDAHIALPQSSPSPAK